VLAIGAGEAPFSWPKISLSIRCGEIAPQLTPRNGLAAPPAEVVHGAGDDLLAGAALAGDEDRDVGRGDADDLLVDLAHRRRASPERAEVALGLEHRLHVAGRRLQRRRLRDAREHSLQLLQAHRLDEVVGSAEAKRLDRRLEARVAGDQDELGVGQLLGVVEQLHAAAVGQHQVERTMSGSCSAIWRRASRSDPAVATVKPSLAISIAIVSAASESSSTSKA
jgi:hypothetical protein